MNQITIRNEQIKAQIRSLLSELPDEDRQEIVAETLTEIAPVESRLADLNHHDFGITDFECVFVMEYVTNGFNATQAYLTARPETAVASARVQACMVKGKAEVQRFIDEMLNRIGLTNSELERRLESIGNASMQDFFSLNDEDKLILDLPKAYASGAFSSVQRIRWTKGSDWPDIQFFDKTRAYDILTRVRGMQKEVRIIADLTKLAQQSNLSEEQLEQLKDAMREELVIDMKKSVKNGETIYEEST